MLTQGVWEELSDGCEWCFCAHERLACRGEGGEEGESVSGGDGKGGER